jgi:hypothetical protein
MIDIASGELSGGRPAGKTLWRAVGLVPSKTPPEPFTENHDGEGASASAVPLIATDYGAPQ